MLATEAQPPILVHLGSVGNGHLLTSIDIMNNSLTLPVKGQTISLVEKLQQKNDFFSAIGGFSVTNLQVILVHAVLASLLLALGVVEHQPLLSLAFVTVAGACAHLLNQTEDQEPGI